MEVRNEMKGSILLLPTNGILN